MTALFAKIGLGSLQGYALMGLLVSLGIFFALWRWEAGAHADTRADLALAKANVEALLTDKGARDRAASQRLTDAARIAVMEEELTDAIANAPAGRPSAASIALTCARLQRSGQNTAAIPACGGSATDSETATAD